MPVLKRFIPGMGYLVVEDVDYDNLATNEVNCKEYDRVKVLSITNYSSTASNVMYMLDEPVDDDGVIDTSSLDTFTIDKQAASAGNSALVAFIGQG